MDTAPPCAAAMSSSTRSPSSAAPRTRPREPRRSTWASSRRRAAPTSCRFPAARSSRRRCRATSSRGEGALLDVVQGDTGAGPRPVRRIRLAPDGPRRDPGRGAPRSRPNCGFVDGFVTGTVRNESDRTLESPAVVLGGSVVVLANILPGPTADVQLRVDSGQIRRDALGQDRSVRCSSASRRRATRTSAGRRRAIGSSPSSPTTRCSATSASSPSDVPVLLAWGRDPVVDVEVQGQEPARAPTSSTTSPCRCSPRRRPRSAGT